MREALNRKKFLKDLEKFISEHNENPELTLKGAAEILLNEVERLGMVPRSRFSGFGGSCDIYDWEENISDDEISREMRSQNYE